MSNFQFKILARDKKTSARVGEIKTAHGVIKTPAFIPVGTKATVKAMTNSQLEEIGVQCFFVNTYHLYLQPGAEVVERMGGLHKFIGWNKPLMTDSGGFQVFSLKHGKARNKTRENIGGEMKEKNLEQKNPEDKDTGLLVGIDEEGVTFKSLKDGSLHHFTPEKSIKIQQKFGADVILAFDECAYYPVTHNYALKAMRRTHQWAERCLKVKKKNFQALYGVVQGSVFEDLRKESANFISKFPFEGIAIGGVSVGESKKEMVRVLDWVVPLLPEGKPRHLLGVGEIDDIFELVQRGIDTFDCVVPTRLGRMGWVLVGGKGREGKGGNWKIDITKAEFKNDKRPIMKECKCDVCQTYSRAYLNHLFRSRELLAYTLATYHNLWFLERLLEEIRRSIVKRRFFELKKKWLSSF